MGANATYGQYQEALNTTKNLEGQMGDLKDEIAPCPNNCLKNKAIFQFTQIDRQKQLQLRMRLKLSLLPNRKFLQLRKLQEWNLQQKLKPTLDQLEQLKKILKMLSLPS